MPVPTIQITRERLARWELRLADSHATPLALFAVGHDQNQGQLVVCTLENEEMDKTTLRMLLQAAIKQLR